MSELITQSEGIDTLSLPQAINTSPNIFDCVPKTSDFLAVPLSSDIQQPRRISRLGPVALRPCAEAGPSKGQRYMYVGVRSGKRTGVYTVWKEAEAQLVDHPDPVFKTFSTKMAADAYVKGWDGAGRHSVPGSCPKPLREHLAMNFPASVPLASTSKRPSYHARLVASAPALSTLPETSDFTTIEATKQSWRKSQVRISSPLCRQVDEEPVDQKIKKKPSWVMGAGGLLSPPPSPEKPFVIASVVKGQRPPIRKASTDSALRSSTVRREFSGPVSSSLSSPSNTSIRTSQSIPTRLSGLWVDSVSPPAPPAADPTPDLAGSAPKFSRSSMRKSSVVMPASAPRSNSSPSLRSRLTRAPSNTSLSSLASSSSTLSLKASRKPSLTPKNSQDRLSTLTATSMREMQADEHGMISFGSLAPPRPAFMKRSTSSSSLASDASGRSVSSMGSLTSVSSACMSSLDSCGPILEEDVKAQHLSGDDHLPPICTKSDADAASQTSAGKKPKKGGLFKRLSRALKMDKKMSTGQDSSRRGSL